MKPLQRRSVIEQSAEYLREALRNGTWSGRMPGVVRLAAEAGVSKITMRAALRLLEDEGLVVLAENGYSRHVASRQETPPQVIRIGILLPEPIIEQIAQFQQLVIEIEHHLADAGFQPFVFPEDLRSLRHDVRRIRVMMAKTQVKACVVICGSREVLEWFATQPLPCMALAGRAGGLPIARVGPDKAPAYVEAIRRLVKLGHRRIVLIKRRERRLPSPGRVERAFLGELEASGIEVSSFNMPEWEETPAGFHKLLAELFRVTPPTAMLVDEVPLWVAAHQFLAQQRIRVPEQVSLVATDDDPSFHWCSPAITRIRWENEPIVRRIGRWAGSVKLGREDRKQSLVPADLVSGGTIGPVARPSAKP